MFTRIIELITLVDGVVSDIVVGTHKIDFTANIKNISAHTIDMRCVVKYAGVNTPTTPVYDFTRETLSGQTLPFTGSFWKIFTETVVLTALTYYTYGGVEHGPEDAYAKNLYYQQVPNMISGLEVTQYQIV